MTVASCTSVKDPSVTGIRAAHKGKVLLLLLGRDGCPGTVTGTATLEDYVKTKSDDVAVVRIDVPLVGEAMMMPAARAQGFEHVVDTGRRVATALEFFYYPTFYVMDKEGTVRFSGGCERKKIDEVVTHLLAEKPGQEKKIWSPPIPAVGTDAPAFKATTVDKREVERKTLSGEKGLVLLFSSTDCPYSVKALPSLTALSKTFADKGVAATIVNQSEQTEKVDALYAKQCPGIPLIHDGGGICRSFGVAVAPFYFLMDGSGKIVARGPFTEAAATQAVQTMLGIKTTTTETPAAGAG